MRIDRSLIGVVLIALVVSTLITLFIIGEKGGPYSIVSNEYRSGGARRFISGITILAKKPMTYLTLSHYCLLNRTDLIENVSRKGEPEEVMERIPSLQTFLGMSEFVPPRKSNFSVRIPLWIGREKLVEKKFHVYVYDFSRIAWQAVPDEIRRSTKRPSFRGGHLWDYYDVFACVFDEKGTLTYFYEGVADFFCGRVMSIEELSVQRNEQKTTYFGVGDEGKLAGGARSVLEAPNRGVVTFDDVRRNDRLAVTFSIDPSRMPLDPTKTYGQIPMYHIMHVVEITADGAAPRYVANMVKPPKPPPPIGV